jgi:hypothetical protein
MYIEPSGSTYFASFGGGATGCGTKGFNFKPDCANAAGDIENRRHATTINAKAA